jgi:beta-phosphoglucomutase-like phosphatase (HAD superfamily)
MFKAFIFDLDGTLIDSEGLWCKALERMVASRGLPVTYDYMCGVVVGHAWSAIAARLLADYPSLGRTIEDLERESMGHYQDLRGTTDIRITGSIRLLERIAQRHPVAIVSGSTRRQVDEALEIMGVGPCLKFTLASEDYPRGKPDPTCFLMAAERFGVAPGECLVFEDSAAGVRAAVAAGMRCIALRRIRSAAQDLGGAHEILSDLADFDAARHGLALD